MNMRFKIIQSRTVYATLWLIIDTRMHTHTHMILFGTGHRVVYFVAGEAVANVVKINDSLLVV